MQFLLYFLYNDNMTRVGTRDIIFSFILLRTFEKRCYHNVRYSVRNAFVVVSPVMMGRSAGAGS